MLNDREGGGREPGLHSEVWGLRHLAVRGRRVTWSWGRTGFLSGKRAASSGRRRPRRAGEGGRGAALGVVRSMGGAKPPLGVLGRE